MQIALVLDGVVVNRWPLVKGGLYIGRNTENDVIISDDAVSSRHARIIMENDKFLDGQINVYIEDLGSTNGTFVDDKKIEKQLVTPRTKIRIAYSEFKIIDPRPGQIEQTAYIANS